jgi:hypothetical protein
MVLHLLPAQPQLAERPARQQFKLVAVMLRAGLARIAIAHQAIALMGVENLRRNSIPRP